MLKIRKATPEDAEQIVNLLTTEGYAIPEQFISVLVVVDESNRVRGIGHLSTLVESTFLIDDSLPMFNRVLALREMMQEAVNKTKELGFRTFTVSTSKDNVERLLVEKFDFENCKGKNLIKGVG